MAGTKGKGSTCAFVDAILSQTQRAHGRPRKTGLFISPHLIAVRERIRIDSAPISEELFARYFFEVWDRLEASAAANPGTPDAAADAATDATTQPGLTGKPVYSRYLTLMSWHVFLQEGVDAAVYETGIGGEYDATNVVPHPVASGITTLGIDHVFALGDTVDKIAWHKAGIMKTGSPAFTTRQVPEADRVLRERAAERDVHLDVLGVDPRLAQAGVRIRPDALFQKRNASLAIALAETALARIEGREARTYSGGDGEDLEPLPETFVRGLEGVVFRGRCEVKTEGHVTWHIDGAHTLDSLRVSSDWFVQETEGRYAAPVSPCSSLLGGMRANDCRTSPRVLIFNQQGRSEAVSFLETVAAATRREGKPSFDHAVFCTNVTYAQGGYKRDFVNHHYDARDIADMVVQRRLAERWAALDPGCDTRVAPTIEEALNLARDVGKRAGVKTDALITGSLHLVGGALGMLDEADAL